MGQSAQGEQEGLEQEGAENGLSHCCVDAVGGHSIELPGGRFVDYPRVMLEPSLDEANPGIVDCAECCCQRCEVRALYLYFPPQLFYEV